MRVLATSLLSAAVVAVLSGATPAAAKCARLSFLVNDYGKDGPTKDAKALLDKHIAKSMTARGITKYTAGKKDVKCELFLDFGVFDEHTCTASATVCWSEGGAPVNAKTAPGGTVPTEPKAAPATKVKAEIKSAPAKAKTAAPTKAKTEPPAADTASSPATPASAPTDGLQAPAPAKLKPKAT